MTMREFALERLRGLYARPRMWAATREAFAAQVVLLLELLDAPVVPLMQKAFRAVHTCAADRDKLIAPVEDDWARAFIDDAMKGAGQQLNREYAMYEKQKP